LAIEEDDLTVEVLKVLLDDGKEFGFGVAGGVDDEDDRGCKDHELLSCPYIGLTVGDLAKNSFASVQIEEGQADCG